MAKHSVMQSSPSSAPAAVLPGMPASFRELRDDALNDDLLGLEPPA